MKLVNLPSYAYYNNLFHFTIGPNINVLGSRCPTVFVYDSQVLIQTQLHGNANALNILQLPIPMHVFTKFYYEQRYDRNLDSYVVRVFVNDTLAKQQENNMAFEFENVKVYTSDQWHGPLQDSVVIKDFMFGSL
jgi:hypothetical protein